MITTENQHNWLSAHIYFEGNIYSDQCDEIVRQVLIPFVESEVNKKLLKKYFFIRYSDSGPHLRVRFYGEEDKLESRLKPLFESSIDASLKTFLSINKDENQKHFDREKFFVKWIPYEPEIERYGGERAIEIAEEFFYYSSITAIEIIKLMSTNDKSSRLGKALASMVILLQRFCKGKEEAARLVSNYSSGYLRAIAKEEKYHEAWIESFDAGFNSQSEKLVELVNLLWAIPVGNELPDPLHDYSENLQVVSQKLKQLCANKEVLFKQNYVDDWETCVQFIIPSYIHMMNNRLGVTIQEEAYLAYLISKGFKVENLV